MEISPDADIFWQWKWIKLNATIVNTWIVMALLVVISFLATRKISYTSVTKIPRLQNFLETLIGYIREQIKEITGQDPRPYIPFLGTLFMYLALANFLSFVPFYEPPTGSLSTTTALALCVFFAVPIYGIMRQGLLGYLKHYIRPSPFMLPFQIIGEVSRTLALAVRLFGNMMSGTLIVGILLSVTPFFVPIIMHALGLLIGQIQAYIFVVLATIYIASASRTQVAKNKEENKEKSHG
ncbi:MAG: F0F1 ATP synthase subunit A [Simkaniaceae bacterium]